MEVSDLALEVHVIVAHGAPLFLALIHKLCVVLDLGELVPECGLEIGELGLGPTDLVVALVVLLERLVLLYGAAVLLGVVVLLGVGAPLVVVRVGLGVGALLVVCVGFEVVVGASVVVGRVLLGVGGSLVVD